MPVILTTREEVETWMTAPWLEAKGLQRTPSDDALVIVEKPATQITIPKSQAVRGSLL